MLWYGGYGQNPHGIYLSGREMVNITVKRKKLETKAWNMGNMPLVELITGTIGICRHNSRTPPKAT